MYKRDQQKETALWQDYQSSANPNDLLLHYLPFARMLAKQQFKMLGFNRRDFDDFIQNANLGLLDAISRFEQSQGVDFHAYAAIRIKGSILNGVKLLSEKSHYHAYMKRIQSERRDSIVIQNSSQKSDSLEGLGQLIVELAYSHLLEELVEGEAASAIVEKDTPYETCQLQQAKLTINKYLKRLPEREYHVITWHYFEFLSFQEISDLIGVSKGRISQLHHQALRRLHTLCAQTPELIA